MLKEPTQLLLRDAPPKRSSVWNSLFFTVSFGGNQYETTTSPHGTAHDARRYDFRGAGRTWSPGAPHTVEPCTTSNGGDTCHSETDVQRKTHTHVAWQADRASGRGCDVRIV